MTCNADVDAGFGWKEAITWEYASMLQTIAQVTFLRPMQMRQNTEDESRCLKSCDTHALCLQDTVRIALHCILETG